MLDEVDQMLDMGFAESVDEILKVAYEKEEESNKPQTLLFSATMPPWVYKTAQKYMSKDVKKVDLIGQQQVKTSTTVQVGRTYDRKDWKGIYLILLNWWFKKISFD